MGFGFNKEVEEKWEEENEETSAVNELILVLTHLIYNARGALYKYTMNEENLS